MSIKKIACLGLIAIGLSASAFALPEIIPHRGIWKSHNSDSNPENTVDAYEAAAKNKTELGNKHPDFVEIDLRMAMVDSIPTVVVYHDKFWDRLTDYTSNPTTDNWAIKAFKDEQPDSHALDTTNLTWDRLNGLTLRRVTKNGYTRSTNEKVVTLQSFINQTACKHDTKLLLDIQDLDVAEKTAHLITHNTCPAGTKHAELLHSEVAYFRPFVGNTIPPVLFSYSAAQMPAAYVDHYGDDIKYVWGLNSGQLDSNCTITPCRIAAPTWEVDTFEFFDAAKDLPNTFAINLSYPGSFPGDDYDESKIAVKNTLDAVFNRYKNQNVTMISSTTRPGGALLFEGKASNGDLASNTKKNFCMPFNYHATVGDIRFFSDDIYNRREAWAKRNGFDYIIVDGYKNGNGKLAYDLATEIEYMCNSTRIVTKFQVSPYDNTDEELKSHYLNLRLPTNGIYHLIDGIQGDGDIYDRYPVASDW